MRIAYENLKPCVGECALALCAALLNGEVKAGVWFPGEEVINTKVNEEPVLALLLNGAHSYSRSKKYAWYNSTRR
jgi:hypothetical protein